MKKFLVWAKYLLPLMVAAAIIFTGCKKNGDGGNESDVYETDDAPPYAASNKVWKVESPDGKIKQIWSDHIQVPACHKNAYDGGTSENPKADCRSYTYEETTFYYYSWQYVSKNQQSLCPHPWRVPTSDDFENVASAFSGNTLDVHFAATNAFEMFVIKGGWLLGGLCFGSGGLDGQGSYGYNWSASEYSAGNGYYTTLGSSFFLPQYDTGKDYGFSLRCVR